MDIVILWVALMMNFFLFLLTRKEVVELRSDLTDAQMRIDFLLDKEGAKTTTYSSPWVSGCDRSQLN